MHLLQLEARGRPRLGDFGRIQKEEPVLIQVLYRLRQQSSMNVCQGVSRSRSDARLRRTTEAYREQLHRMKLGPLQLSYN